MLGYLVPLMGAVERLSLNVGECTEEQLSLVTNQEAAMLKQAQANYLQEPTTTTMRRPGDRARSVLVQHATPCEWKQFSTLRPKVVIGRTMTERNGIESAWVQCCTRVDEIWVPTQWAADVFASSGVPQNKLVVMPEGIDVRLFQPKRQRNSPREIGGKKRTRPFVFLSVFKWEARKGVDLLLDAFWTAFTRTDNVVLRLRTYVPHWEVGRNVTRELVRHARKVSSRRAKGWRRLRPRQQAPTSLSTLAKVEVVGGGASGEEGALSRDEMRNMYDEADCFVLPTRGEGWGLPVVEAMAMELPVIVTNHSGPASYMTQDNAYPLNSSVVVGFKEVTRRNVNAAVPVGGYAEPDFDHLLALMRHVTEHQDEARHKGRRARQDVVATLSSEAVSARMLQRMLVLRYRAAAAKTRRGK